MFVQDNGLIASSPYVLQATIANVNLGQLFQLNDTTSFFPGEFPNGIPLTIELKGFSTPHIFDLDCFTVVLPITETPPLLFETKCRPEIGVSFGGCPTVYLHNPSGNNEFHISSLKSRKLVRHRTDRECVIMV